MQLQMGSFPDLATNLIYSILCLVPGFISLQTSLRFGDYDRKLDQFDKTTWSLIGSGVSLSLLYFAYVAWMWAMEGARTLIVPVDLQWTELVAAYPLLLVLSVVVGYLGSHTLARPSGEGTDADAASGGDETGGSADPDGSTRADPAAPDDAGGSAQADPGTRSDAGGATRTGDDRAGGTS